MQFVLIVAKEFVTFHVPADNFVDILVYTEPNIKLSTAIEVFFPSSAVFGNVATVVIICLHSTQDGSVLCEVNDQI